MTRKIICIILSIMLVIIPILTLPKASIAATESELREKNEELRQNIKEAEEKMKELQNKSNEAKSELESLNDEIGKKEAEVEKITDEVNALTAEVNELKKQLEEAQEKYDKQYDMLGKRLAAQYRKGKTTYLDVLLNSSSISDFITNYRMIEKLAEIDTKIMKEIEEQKVIIDTSKRETEKKQKEAEAKQAELNLEKLALSNKISNKNKYINQLSAEEQEAQKEIDNFNKQIKQNDSAIQEIVRQNSMNSGGIKYTGGAIEWPVPSSHRITSGYGYRGSAATGGVGTANHNGYDIGAPHYSTVVAAEAGKVIKVVSGCTHDYPKTFSTRCYCGGGYGNYLMISHGGLTTLYGHVAKINVSVGQTVARGQKIAEVGSCGWSTGYHLHFSVLNANGAYVDPGNYFN